jgi:hypothetical protein
MFTDVSEVDVSIFKAEDDVGLGKGSLSKGGGTGNMVLREIIGRGRAVKEYGEHKIVVIGA